MLFYNCIVLSYSLTFNTACLFGSLLLLVSMQCKWKSAEIHFMITFMYQNVVR